MATAPLGTLLRHLHHLAAGGLPQQPDRQFLDSFSAAGDEAAFAALVARHGPMVLRVCRRVLNHEQDAEDAFQATFLVLARHTGSIRKREALAQWLHGVAYRTAMHVRRKAARRRKHEARLRTSAAPSGRGRETAPQHEPPQYGPMWDDVQAVLDEEIQRLPEAFRAAFVLCVLEGKTVPEAATELGVKAGTVSSRLTRARQRLRRQLARRGIQLSALLAALALAENAGRGAMPAALAGAAVRCGLSVAAGGSSAGQIPSQVAALAAGVTRAMLFTKAKIATAVLLSVGLIAAAGGLTHETLRARQTPAAAQAAVPPAEPQPPAQRSAKPGPAAVPAGTAYRGRVVGPDGRAVPGAKLYLAAAWADPEHPYGFRLQATTGADGRFKFPVPKDKYGEEPRLVAATAPNYGLAWTLVPVGAKPEGLSLQLVKDDVPITGQLVDLEGKPVQGATLSVSEVYASPKEDLGPWLEAVRAKRGLDLRLREEYLPLYTPVRSMQVMTGAAGRFRLTGLGRDRVVRLRLDGPGIVSQYLHVLTRPGKPIEVLYSEYRSRDGEQRLYTTYYGAAFRHVTAPSRPIVGVVRDKDTKRPLAGITIRGDPHTFHPSFVGGLLRTKTDARGRYRLTGMPKDKGNQIRAEPGADQPYHVSTRPVPDTPGLSPVSVNVELKRGIWIEGKITDKVTGKPVRTSMEYFSLYGNPNLRDYPGLDNVFAMRRVATKEDGSYRVAGIPGPGLVVVGMAKDYLRVMERDDEFGVKQSLLNKGTAPYGMPFTNFAAFAYIDPARGVDPAQRDITLDPGWTFTGKVLGPDGKPLAGARGFGLTGDRCWEDATLKAATFTVHGFNPHRPREVLFQHRGKGLVGVVRPPKARGESVTVRLEPGATFTGRLVDADGRPRAGVWVGVLFRTRDGTGHLAYPPEHMQTDAQGRFRIGALVPGYEYSLSDGKGEVRLGKARRGGETKDLGDVQVRRE